MLFWPLDPSGINGTLRQIYWHWPKCGFVISEAQYWCFPLVSAGIWQDNHFPIYSFCNIMRCIMLWPHRAELWLNNTANIPRKPGFLYTLDTYLGLRNWNPRGRSILFSQHIGTCPGEGSPSMRALLGQGSRGYRLPASCSAHVGVFLPEPLFQLSCHPAGAPARKSWGRYGGGSPQPGIASTVNDNNLGCLYLTFCGLIQISSCSLSDYFGLSTNLEWEPL